MSQDKLFEKKKGGAVSCLGMTFESDEARRQYFTDKLREKLKDPEFRKIEGFPIAQDEDILALSDPPYYTACPNPWIADFISEWQTEKAQNSGKDDALYDRKPFAADVSEGKNDPIYNAHSYHTKVPHKAIMRYILHYTGPGDIVFDGFCGTGMTGVAAQLCGDRSTVESLGYKVQNDGTILQEESDANGKSVWKPFSKLGARKAILNDLSPAATFIAYNYNAPVDVVEFQKEASRILKEVEAECGWMYETTDPHSGAKGKINYTVWSDVFVCPNCSNEVIFWKAAVDSEASKIKAEFPCPHCNALLNKDRMGRAWVSKFDKAVNQTIRQAKQVPVLIKYFVGKRRYEKEPDAQDIALIQKVEESLIPYWFPTDRMPEGDESRRNDDIGMTHVHHFYTKRNLWVLAAFRKRVRKQDLLVFQSVAATLCSRLSRYNMGRRGNGPLSGTLYVSSLNAESNCFLAATGKISDFTNAFRGAGNCSMHCTSLTEKNTVLSMVDYVFTDPPFGGNLMYSELNFLWESWLKVFTSNKSEAIENNTQGKGLFQYQRLMSDCFYQYYSVLKPGRWMTVEFHNSQNRVWNAIQEALQRAGFVVADVRTLDKQQGTFKQIMASASVKQDLIISAYKPVEGLEERFKLQAGTEQGVWDFVREHLKQLPVVVISTGAKRIETVAERQAYLLFDRMVAFHVQRGVSVPLSAAEFYAGLAQRFSERDSMWFLPEQVVEYDRKRMSTLSITQPDMFVLDEATAIQWLRQKLTNRPQTFQEIHPQYMKEIAGWQKHEKSLELIHLLEQNFIKFDDNSPIPSRIVSWLKRSEKYRPLINQTETTDLTTNNATLLAAAKDRWYVPDPNKQIDLERIREKALLKEFDEYKAGTSGAGTSGAKKTASQKLKVFRIEAVRAGFKKAYQDHDYQTIISVAKRIQENVLQEDDKLLMWYDQALTRTEK
jgi:DNA modification methylase/rubredoxin